MLCCAMKQFAAHFTQLHSVQILLKLV